MTDRDLVMEYFLNPRNAGPMEAPDREGRAGSPEEGGYVVLQLRLAEGRIAEARFQTFGCGYAIAACSLLTEWVTGMASEEAQAIDATGLCERLGGVPSGKVFCAELAVAALRAALDVQG